MLHRITALAVHNIITTVTNMLPGALQLSCNYSTVSNIKSVHAICYCLLIQAVQVSLHVFISVLRRSSVRFSSSADAVL